MQDPTLPPGVQWTDLVAKSERPRRPGLIIASGVLMIVSGAFGALTALVLLSSDVPLPSSPSARHVVTLIADIALGLAALQVLAGMLILGQRRVGRTLGIVLAALGIVGSILQLGLAPSRALVGIALNAFVMYSLTAHKAAFGRFDD
jgi:hypothetical protein